MKQSLHYAYALTLLLIFFSGRLAADPLYGNFYVKASATGANNGTSWTDAFTDLQSALEAAASGDLICVAAGSYFPTFRFNGDSLRYSTFYINKDLILLGGFAGEPGTEGTMEGRDPAAHLTILSGDIGVLGNNADNAFHVVYFDHVSDTTRLDGFIIEKGNGFDAAGYDAIGTGIFNNAEAGRSNPRITNCTIRDNNTNESGGGFYFHAANGGRSNSIFTNCTFISNRASGGGGMGIYTDTDGNVSPVFINCRFMGNSGPTAGGAAMTIIGHSAVASPRLINCIITGNHSPTSSAVSAFVTGTGITRPEFINCAFSGNTGGAVRVSNIGSGNCALIARNSIFWNNESGTGVSASNADIDITFSVIPFGFPGEGNIGLDPMFVSTPPIDSAHTLGDLHLQAGSLALDAGRDSDVPTGIVTDLDGKPRFINASNGQPGSVDIGPYEFEGTTTAVRDVHAFNEWNIYPNPAQDVITITLPEDLNAGVLQLHDVHGALLSAHRIAEGRSNHTITISHFPSGIYFIQLRNEGGQDVKKLIIE